MNAEPASDGGDAAPLQVDELEKVRRLEAVAPMVRAMCASRLRSDGDDAAQAVLEQVWRAQHQQVFEDEESVRRYAATLARVMPPSVDRRSVRAAPVGAVAEALWVDETPGPADRFDRTEAMAEAADKVSALLEQLTPREREVIRTMHLGERSTAEAAVELGLTPSGVRSAQTRAMARMRESMHAASTNPLASGVPERERRRSADRQAGRGYPEGPRSAPVIEAAERFSAQQGRPPSRSELVGLTGTSGGTAQRVLRALRDERQTRSHATGSGPVDSAVPELPPPHSLDTRDVDVTARAETGRAPDVAAERQAELHAGQQFELIPAGPSDDRSGTVYEEHADDAVDPDHAVRDAAAAVERARIRAAARHVEGVEPARTPGAQTVLWDAEDPARDDDESPEARLDHGDPLDAAHR